MSNKMPSASLLARSELNRTVQASGSGPVLTQPIFRSESKRSVPNASWLVEKCLSSRFNRAVTVDVGVQGGRGDAQPARHFGRLGFPAMSPAQMPTVSCYSFTNESLRLPRAGETPFSPDRYPPLAVSGPVGRQGRSGINSEASSGFMPHRTLRLPGPRSASSPSPTPPPQEQSA
jgi:hypothetical protein